MGQQSGYKTIIGVHLTMHPNYCSVHLCMCVICIPAIKNWLFLSMK